MKAFLTPLQGLAEFEQIKEKSKTNKGILQVSGCMESQKSHLMYGLSGIAPYRLILRRTNAAPEKFMKITDFMTEKCIFILRKIFCLSGRYPWKSADTSEDEGH